MMSNFNAIYRMLLKDEIETNYYPIFAEIMPSQRAEPYLTVVL
ncbi:hypothetical protein WN944_011788 [Citrus x changshan-huyou]|uniref:Uncharacterized protein n=1 Tax=Citrus x changshan-huyou TaxID=2935761 RepID=A0AAP0QZ31_9ROSI